MKISNEWIDLMGNWLSQKILGWDANFVFVQYPKSFSDILPNLKSRIIHMLVYFLTIHQKVLNLFNWNMYTIQIASVSILTVHYNWCIQWSVTTLQYSPFIVLCALGSVLYTPDLTSPCKTGYNLYYTAGAWQYQVQFTLPGHLFTHLGFPECPCYLACDIYFRFCYVYGLWL